MTKTKPANNKIKKDEIRFLQLQGFDAEFYSAENQRIAGIDEVGRGCLAGPVVACAIILPRDFYLLGVDDSKKISVKKREKLADGIIEQALDFSLSIIGNCVIERENILEATKIAMKDTVTKLSIEPELILVDGITENFLGEKQRTIIGGDNKSLSIAAASIVAKVYRDNLMKELALSFPGYGFERNKGYGTAEHLKFLKEKGPSPIHRRTFKPVADLISEKKVDF